MKDSVYFALKNVSWECIKCGKLNFSSALFDTSLFETTNSFDPLTHDVSDHEISFSCPQATSSPKTVPSYQPRAQHVSTSSSTAPDTPSVALSSSLIQVLATQENLLLFNAVPNTEMTSP